MADLLKRTIGQAEELGASLYTAPANSRVTLIGIRAANTDNTAGHWIEITLNGTYITGREVPLPIGGAYDFVEGKIVLEAGDVITATADQDATVDIVLSYLEQIPDA